MVAEATRLLVTQAVEKTGYRINLAASNLRRRRTGTIVVMVPNLGNPFFSSILASIESVAAAAGLGVLLVDTKQNQASRQQVFAHLHRTRSDGLIVLDGALAMDSPAGLVHARFGPAGQVAVDMGAPRFEAAALPFIPPAAQTTPAPASAR